MNKQDFFIPHGIYLLNHSVGCLPRTTALVKEEFFEMWKLKGGEAWGEWLNLLDGFCHSLATLLNGYPDEFCPQTNLSSAISKILLSLPLRRDRNKIVISEMDFPSIGFAISQMKRMGYQIEVIPAQNGRLSLESWKKYLTPDVELALITHVSYGNSFLNPVKEIIDYAKEKGIITVVDVAQSVGVVPIDVHQWNGDFVIGCCIKWLCGGPGAGFMWVNSEKVTNFQPMDVGWFSHENPFEFDINNFRYAKTAKRFWGGTPSVLPFAIAKLSIDTINRIGVNLIRQHNQRLIQRLIEAAVAQNLKVCTPLDSSQRGGTVAIAFPNPMDAYQRFKEANILIDMRPNFGLRFSPHIYNDEAEIDQIVDLLISNWYLLPIAS